MRRFAGLTLLIFALIAVLGTVGFCATTKKTATKKPAAKPKATSTAHYVQGTTQLKGEYADFGTTYTLGKESPLNITIKSAEYSVEPVKIGEMLYVPTAEEKLLVLHMVYHNPQPSEQYVRWDTLGFTVVDPQSQNHDGLKDLGMEKDKLGCSMSMKPAQKIEVYGVMMVPAAAEMPKLIIKSSDELVLRYNLKGKVKGLQAPFADPADKTGATALATINAQMGTYYPFGEFSVKIDSAEYSDKTQMADIELEEGQRFLVVQMGVKNVSAGNQFLRWDSITSKVTDTDDTDVSDCRDMLQKSKDKSFSADVKPGQELTVRCIYIIPDDTDLKSLSEQLGEGRTFIFDLSGVK
ncbi:MAG: DUF4352 domain-containing protein [Armatimonadota bacterium]|nr:DUF4352 domain-containing protein [bacterium]